MSRQASQAVGYAEIAAHLRGDLGYPQMVELIQRRTRQFSKRQRTWFRHLEELTIFDISDGGSLEDVTQRIQAFFKAENADSI
jgi:tRNA dimethylallyltransferase